MSSDTFNDFFVFELVMISEKYSKGDKRKVLANYDCLVVLFRTKIESSTYDHRRVGSVTVLSVSKSQ